MSRSTAARSVSLLVIGGLALAGLILAGRQFGDEQRIRRRITRIQRLIAKAPGESQTAGLGKARALAELFADSFEASAEAAGPPISDRRSLVAVVHQYRSRSTTLVMEITGLQVFLDGERVGANTFFRARFLSDLQDLTSGESYDVRIHWAKTDRGWLIDHVGISGADSRR